MIGGSGDCAGSFETFAAILEDWDAKGTLSGLLERYPIPLRSAYVTVNVTDSAAQLWPDYARLGPNRLPGSISC